MKEFTITVKPGGDAEISLRNYEQETEQIAKDFEDALGGKVEKRDWRPGQHPHVHAVLKHRHYLK